MVKICPKSDNDTHKIESICAMCLRYFDKNDVSVAGSDVIEDV